MLCELVGGAYMLWRPMRSLSPPQRTTSVALSSNPSVLAYSAIFYLSELILFLPSILFVFVELWRPIERENFDLGRILKSYSSAKNCDYANMFPTIDIVITCYNEPVDIGESETYLWGSLLIVQIQIIFH